MNVERVGIFFDRDGTINTEVDYLSRPDELKLFPKAAKAIREANRYGAKVFIITNQSGIARGFLTENNLRAIHRRLLELLAEQDARIDAIYFCPHHPLYGHPPYRKECTCRKPKTGMLLQAHKDHGIDLQQSFVVGDRCIDIKAGEHAGCGTVLVLTGYGAAEREECLSSARVDKVAPDVYGAWQYIRKRISAGNR